MIRVPITFGFRIFRGSTKRVGEGKHKAAVLEQQLVRERSSREAIQNALRNELVESKEQLAVEIHKVRQESKRNLDEAISGLQQQVQILAKEHSDALESKELGNLPSGNMEPPKKGHGWLWKLMLHDVPVEHGWRGIFCGNIYIHMPIYILIDYTIYNTIYI
jgi:rubrerythrin